MVRRWPRQGVSPERMHDSLVNHVTLYRKNQRSLKDAYAITLNILDDETSSVQLHSTHIITFYKDKPYCKLNDGGWQTLITKSAMNTYVPRLHLWQRRYQWYLNDGNKTPEREIKCRCCHGNAPQFDTTLGRLAHLTCECNEYYARMREYFKQKNQNVPAWYDKHGCTYCYNEGTVTVGGNLATTTPYYSGMLIDMRTGLPYDDAS